MLRLLVGECAPLSWFTGCRRGRTEKGADTEGRKTHRGWKSALTLMCIMGFD